MICSIFPLSAFASSSPDAVRVDGNIAYIDDYMEFYNNQDYYNNWAFSNGYSLAVNVPSEYMDLEIERIVGNSTIHELSSEPLTRGLSIPTATWNLSEKGKYSFSVESAASPIYTNYKFTGTHAIHVLTTLSISNRSAGGTAYGVDGGPQDFSTSTGTSISTLLFTSEYNYSFYLRFNAPAYLIGSIT